MTHAAGPGKGRNGRARRILALASALAALSLAAPGSAGAVPLHAGDLLVADPEAAGGQGAVILVDPKSGSQTIVSSGADPSLGASFDGLNGIALGPDGRIYTTGRQANSIAAKVIRVNPATGFRVAVAVGDKLTSDFGGPRDLAFEPTGNLLVTTISGVGPAVHPALIRVNPATGAQTEVSTRGFFSSPWGVAVDSVGEILVADTTAWPLSNCTTAWGSACGAILGVNPVTGTQRVISNGGDDSLGAISEDPLALVPDAKGRILVADPVADLPGPGFGGVVRVDPASGFRLAISVAHNFAQVSDLDRDATGDIFAVDPRAMKCAGTCSGAVIRVDPTHGNQAIVSSGGEFRSPQSIAVVPPECAGAWARIVGSPRPDQLSGSRFGDVIVAGRGADKVTGGKGRDLICGGAGTDLLKGGPGRDVIFGGKGEDQIRPGPGKDRVLQ